MDTLKVVTTTVVTTTTTTVTEEKYKVVAPETMHETFMSDSEDEGGMTPNTFSLISCIDFKIIESHEWLTWSACNQFCVPVFPSIVTLMS